MGKLLFKRYSINFKKIEASGNPYFTYVGGGWSKAGFNSFEDWIQFVKSEKEKIDQPFIITIN